MKSFDDIKTTRVIILMAVSFIQTAPAAPGDALQEYLDRGKTQEANQLWQAKLAKNPSDDNVRFEAAVAQVAAGTEALAQNWYRHGLRSAFEEMVPFLRMPIPINPQPEPITYEQVRQALLDFQATLDQTAAQLDAIPDSSQMKVPIDVMSIQLQVSPGNGATEPKLVPLWNIFYHRGPGAQPPLTNGMVHFDAGDARWLQGYCQLLSAMIDIQTAYDERELFNHTAQLFFAKPSTPYPYLQGPARPSLSYENILDAISFVHLLNFKLENPTRLSSAREKLLQVIRLSRRSWKDIEAETDNDHEWIPNPRQDGTLIPGKVTPEMLLRWHRFLDESESLLEGKTLAPFWRHGPGVEERGVNIKKAFTQARDFDLVLWLQGTAADPYLEKGTVTDTRFWPSLNQSFRGNFLFYAIWFN